MMSLKYRFRSTASLLAAVALCGAVTSTGSDTVRAAAESVAPAGNGVVVRRLSQEQYHTIIADVFGPGMKIGGRFEPVPREEGLLAVGAARVGLTTSGFEQYDAMARTVAAQVVDPVHRKVLIPCKPAAENAPDETCAKQFLSQAGELLYRRPLNEREITLQLKAANQAAATLKSFYSGLESSLALMLVAPQFLYRQETVEADPANPGQYRLDSYSKASRLSFMFWNAAPDPQLLAAAKSGALHTDKGLAREIDRLMASPRFESGVRAFFSDMLGFDEFNTLAKDGTIYPKFTSYVSEDAKEQTLRTVTDLLLINRGDYRDLFTTRKTFLTPLLASVYGVPLLQNKPNGYPESWHRHEYPEGDPRAGVLTHVSFVSLHSHPGRTSPTIRGKAMREMIMCQRVPDPPGNVNFTVVQDTTNPLYKTARERLNAHATEAMCTGCHKITDPIGLALENFDSAGSYRTHENGAKLDTSGALNTAQFTDAAGLGQAMHDSAAVSQCLVRRMSTFALGRTTTPTEAGWVKSLNEGFAADAYRIPDLMKRIATSPEFVRVRAPEPGV
jgi:hypothetical protein